VAETLDDVVESVLEFRARIIAMAGAFERHEGVVAKRGRLAAVPVEPRTL
jgi:hypothetical protein